MPATGLPDVKQKAIFDASGYKKGADETVIAAIAMAQANRDAVKSFDEVYQMQIKAAAALAGTEGQFRRLVSVQKDIDSLHASVKSYTEGVRGLANGYEFLTAASERTAEAQQDIAKIAVASIGIQKQAQQEYYETVARVAQASKNIQMAALGEVAAGHVKLQQEIEATGRAIDQNFVMKAPQVVRAINTIQSKAESLQGSLRKVQEQIADIAAKKGDSKIAAAFGDAGATPGPATVSILGPALAAAMGASRQDIAASFGRDRTGEVIASQRESFEKIAPNIARAMRADDESRRYSSVIPTLLSGLGAVVAAASLPAIRDAAGGAGRAIGTGARYAGYGVSAVATVGADLMRETVGSGAGSFDMGRAATDSLAVGNFIKRWYPVAHWAMMLSNELLATVGPATVAAGMGGLVGMQGGEQFVPRAQAIFNTAESLGDSLGKTTGQAFGLKNSPLQTAQDLATGGAFGLAGAGVNMLRAGAGDAFVQLGTNTVAMFDRFAATMTQEFQHGLGKQLGNIVAGGTGYLQQLGDVLANVGDIFLHTAPNLPGVGGDLLSTLQGATGGLAKLTGWLGPALGPILAFEGGARWGPTLVGGAARALGRVPGGLFGSVGRTATAADAAALGIKEGETIAGRGVAGALGSLGAGDIGAIAAAALLINKAATYKTQAQLSADQTMQGINQMGFAQGVPAILSAMRKAGNVPDTIAGSDSPLSRQFSGLGEIGAGIGKGKPSEIWQGVVKAYSGVLGFFSGSSGMPSNFTVAQQALHSLSTTMVNALGAGQQVANVWKGITGQTLDMGKAYDVATMAQLQLGSAFEKNGRLTSQAKTMIANLQAGYQAMNFSGGQFGAAVGAQTAMSGLQHSQIGAVNSAYDQLLQIVTGGAAGASGFFGTLGGAPVSRTRGGYKMQAPPAFAAMAQALTSFTTPGGAAAWSALTNSQSGLIPQLGSQTDWLRTMQTMGALSSGQTTQMAAFQMQQLLPMMRHSPAGLAMLSTIGQEFGGPVMQAGLSQEQNFKNIAKWTGQFAADAKTYNQNMNKGTVAASSIPRDAQQFVQQIGSNIVGGLAQGITTHGADLQNRFMDSMINSGGNKVDAAALRNYSTFIANSGIPKAAGLDMAHQVAQRSGAGSNAAITAQINAAISGAYAKVKITADTSQIGAAMNKLQDKVVKAKVQADGGSQVKTLQASIDALRSKTVQAAARAQGAGAVAALNAEIAALHSKIVTIEVVTINKTITQNITTAGGVANSTLAGGPANMRLTSGGHAAGFRVPGYGGGDIHPAMLEGGETVVPKHLTPLVAPLMSAHGVPGFAAGGYIGQPVFGSLRYWLGANGMARWNPALMAMLQQQMQATQGGFGIPHMPVGNPGIHPYALTGGIHPSAPVHGVSPQRQHFIDTLLGQINKDLKNSKDLKNVSVSIIDGIAAGMKNIGAGSQKIAREMVNQISKEMKYAQGVAQAAAYGQGYDPSGKGSGIFGGMNLTSPSGLTAAQQHPAGPNSPGFNAKDWNAYVAAYAQGDPTQQAQSVQDQMKSYLKTEQSFGKDIGKLRKQHLNKAVLAQLIAAGPQQGDALAQSILGGQGGVRSVNQLWNQINKASKKLGAQAAMGQYGGTVAPNLKSGTFVNNNVSISVSVGGGGKGDLADLSQKDLNALIQKIQTALLKQAKRNRKTGIQQKGKGA